MGDKMISSSRALFDRLRINAETGRRPATSAPRLRVSEQRTSDVAAGNTSFINTGAPQQPAARRSDARQSGGGGVVVGGGGTRPWRGEKQQDFVFSHLSDNRSHGPRAGGGDSSAAFADSPWFQKNNNNNLKNILKAPLSSPLPDVWGWCRPTLNSTQDADFRLWER